MNEEEKKRKIEELKHNYFFYRFSNDYTKRLKLLYEIQKLDLHDSDLYNEIGIIHYLKNEYKKSLRNYNKAIKIKNNFSLYYQNRGNLYSHWKKYNKAYKDYKKIIELDCENYKGYERIGYLYFIQEKYSEALEKIDYAIELAPRQSEPYNLKGLIYFYKKENDNSIIFIKKAIKLMPEAHHLYYNLAYVYLKTKNYEKVIETIQISLEKCSYISIYIYMILSHIKIHYSEVNLVETIENILNKIINKTKNANIKNKSLYSYVAFDKNSISSIVEEYKYANQIYNFNDSNDPVIRLTSNYKDTKNIYDKIRIACFTTENDNILMYSHYSNKHEGICIEYDFSDFENKKNMALLKIMYLNNLLIEENYIDNKLNVKIDSDINIALDFIKLFSIKHKKWEYEDEYRIITYGVDKIYLPIKAIYLGKEMSESDIILLKNIIETKNKEKEADKKIKLYKVNSKSTNLFELETTEL